jgi:hypothetical protein
MDDQTPELAAVTTPRSEGSGHQTFDPTTRLTTVVPSPVDAGPAGDHLAEPAASHRRPGSRAPLPRVAQHVPGYYLG